MQSNYDIEVSLLYCKKDTWLIVMIGIANASIFRWSYNLLLCYCSLLIVQRDTERKTINQEEHQPNNKEMRSTNLVFCPFLCIPCCRSINQFSFFFLFHQHHEHRASLFWTNIREKLSVAFFSTLGRNVTCYLVKLW